jgi:predicted DNA-binding transcriptional regulator AlpA
MIEVELTDRVVTLKAVARAFDTNRQSVWEWIKAGTFPKPFRPGGGHGRVYWHASVIEEALKRSGM